MNTNTAPPDYRYWRDYHRSPFLAIEKRQLVNQKTKIFTMGSCFAMEVRRALVEKNFDVYPKYRDLRFDRATQIFDMLPERDSIAHYDTFSIRQEFEAAFGVFGDRAAGFCTLEGQLANQHLNAPVVYQDPYRKLNYAATVPLLTDLAAEIDRMFYEGIANSDVFVITLGLTEVWQHNRTGRYFCRPPGAGYGGGKGEATFRQSTFAENYENVSATLDLLLKHFPDKQVVLSVSPVPLERTFARTDIGTANLESKSILRAVAGQIAREYEKNVLYLPSYEMATIMPGPAFAPDGRHVLPEFADNVINTFLRFCAKPL
ncbi:MAG: GSCFA domain-containing protein [Rhodospirillaceae bacterium]|nr:GSCFA domain-containing protein [Rhodospirillaceae bacterium]